MADFDDLLREAETAPITGWDFSWLDGRATEARPSWHFSERVAERAATATNMLDLQSGDGALLAALPHQPSLLVATDAYAPNVTIAAERLPHVVANDDHALPFRDASFDLVTCRHPIVAWWTEIARVLAPGGTYFAQHVGYGSVREVTEWFIPGQEVSMARHPDTARRDATAAGLDVVDVRYEELPMAFDDVAAVIYFLRLVIWIVPGFTVERYRDRLHALHDHIAAYGPFAATSTRFLIDATKPR